MRINDLERGRLYRIYSLHESGIEGDEYLFLGVGYVYDTEEGVPLPIAVFQKQGELADEDEDGLLLVNQIGLANPNTQIHLVEP